jgi:lipopolysaccharide export system protein LptA
MKLVRLIAAVALYAAVWIPAAISQENKFDQLHQKIGEVSLTASSMERDMSQTFALQLKGNVEIKKPLCVRPGRKRGLICDEAMVLKADEAEYRADTGEIIPRGNVRVSFEKLK